MTKPSEFLRPVDRLLTVYLAGLTLILLFFGMGIASFNPLIFFNLIFILGLISFSFLREKLGSGFLHFCLSSLPLIAAIYLYKESGRMVHIFYPGWHDNLIINFEMNLFRVLPNFWLERFFSPAVTEILMFAYFIYLPMIPFLCIYFYFKINPQALDQFLFPLILAYLICFLGFFIFPAASPRFVLEGGRELQGFIFRKIMLYIEGNGQFQGGSFPSAHCAAGTVMILLSYRFDKKVFAFVCPVILLFFLATVYGRYHYFSDVIAGILIGVASVYLSRKYTGARRSSTGSLF
ncbi:MAG TPA: phosphatase PAP2 family protein [Terriglobales bacterium]|nr:phosphatase PAP2 family protein [Terriglobales bacterium]